LLHNGFIDDDRPKGGSLPNKFLISVNFEPPGVFLWLKNNNNNNQDDVYSTNIRQSHCEISLGSLE